MSGSKKSGGRWLVVGGGWILAVSIAAAPAQEAPPETTTPRPDAGQAVTSAAGALLKAVTGTKQYTASAFLHVAVERPHVAFAEAEGLSRDNYEVYKRTQEQLLKSPLVLCAALRPFADQDGSLVEPQKFSVLEDSTDKIAWLKNNIRVTFPGDAEIMEVSLSGSDREELPILVNAVVDAYLQEVMDSEHRRKRERLVAVQAAYAEKTIEVRKERAQLESLARVLGTVSDETLALKMQLAVQELAAYRSEHLRVLLERDRARMELTLQETMLDGVHDMEIPDFEVDAVAQSDPVLGQVINRLRREVMFLRGQALKSGDPSVPSVWPESRLCPPGKFELSISSARWLPMLHGDASFPDPPGLDLGSLPKPFENELSPDYFEQSAPELPFTEDTPPSIEDVTGAKLFAIDEPTIRSPLADAPPAGETPRLELPALPPPLPPVPPAPESRGEQTPELPAPPEPPPVTTPPGVIAPGLPVPLEPRHESPESIRRQLAAVEEELRQVRDEMRQRIRDARRVELTKAIHRAQIEVAFLTAREQRLAGEVKSKQQEAEDLGQRSIEMEMKRSHIEQLEKVLYALAEDKEKLAIEIEAAPRVRILSRAEVPLGAD